MTSTDAGDAGNHRAGGNNAAGPPPRPSWQVEAPPCAFDDCDYHGHWTRMRHSAPKQRLTVCHLCGCCRAGMGPAIQSIYAPPLPPGYHYALRGDCVRVVSDRDFNQTWAVHGWDDAEAAVLARGRIPTIPLGDGRRGFWRAGHHRHVLYAALPSGQVAQIGSIVARDLDGWVGAGRCHDSWQAARRHVERVLRAGGAA